MGGIRRIITGVLLVTGCVSLLAACGGSDTSSTAEVPQNAQFEIAQQSDVGLRNAFATFASRSDGKTSVIIELSVERTAEAADDVYPASINEGTCDAPGNVTTTIGKATNGTNTLLVDKSYDEVVKPLNEGSSTIVILKDGGKDVAWCGATPATN